MILSSHETSISIFKIYNHDVFSFNLKYFIYNTYIYKYNNDIFDIKNLLENCTLADCLGTYSLPCQQFKDKDQPEYCVCLVHSGLTKAKTAKIVYLLYDNIKEWCPLTKKIIKDL